MKERIVSVSALAFVLIIAGTPCAKADVAEYVQNGSFEQLSGPGQPADWNLGLWTLQTGFAEDGQHSLSTSCSGPGFCIATLTQTLSDPIGETLNGSLWYLPNSYGYGPPNDLSVLVNGVTVLDVPNAVNNTWVQETFSFTSTGSDVLQIDGWNYPATSFIDNVSVTGPAAVATPEPSRGTYVLVGALCLLIELRRRHRSKTAQGIETVGS